MNSRNLSTINVEETLKQDLCRVRVLLSATPEDIIMFTLGLCDDGDFSGGARRDAGMELLHLMVRPVGRAEGAARLLPDR